MLRDPFREVKTAGDLMGKDFVRNMIRTPPHAAHQAVVDSEPFLSGNGGGHCGTLMTNIRSSDNSLSLEMMDRFKDLVFKYASDNVLWTVIWKAFDNHLCTGVDLYSIYEELHRSRSVKRIREFYQKSYQVAYWLANLEKPMMPLLQGDVAGIGAGMALSAVFPLATETTRVSLPGCRYGSLGAEGGALFKFSRLPGRMGEYLMISGKTLHSADVVQVGLATQFMPSDRAEALHERIGSAHSSDLPTLLNCMDPFMDLPDDSTILKYLPSINRCFSQDSIADIVKALEEETEHVEWAQNTLKAMSANSPLAMAITLKVTRLGRFLPLLNCLNLEYAVMARLIQHPEYAEGVSAFVESRTPQWTYATHEEVPEREVNSFIDNLPIRKTLRLEKINPLAIRLDPVAERERFISRLGFPTVDSSIFGEFTDGPTADLPETVAWAQSEILKPAGLQAYHRLLNREEEMLEVVEDLNFDITFSEMTHSSEG
jgi:3-hydroxyisobutyryl-CoA hydrolase